jgi:hypothetical protein
MPAAADADATAPVVRTERRGASAFLAAYDTVLDRWPRDTAT